MRQDRPLAILVLVVVGLAGPAGLGAEAVAQQPPAMSPTEPEVPAAPEKPGGWYGYQILLADAAAVGLILVEERAEDILPGLTLFMLDGPFIHALHGRGGRAGISLAGRVVIPLATYVVLTTAADFGPCFGNCDDSGVSGDTVVLIGVAASLGFALVDALLARD